MWKLFVAGALLASVSAGCATYTVVRSVQGKAYVVKGNKMYNCDATSGEPICYQVVEVPQPAGK